MLFSLLHRWAKRALICIKAFLICWIFAGTAEAGSVRASVLENMMGGYDKPLFDNIWNRGYIALVYSNYPVVPGQPLILDLSWSSGSASIMPVLPTSGTLSIVQIRNNGKVLREVAFPHYYANVYSGTRSMSIDTTGMPAGPLELRFINHSRNMHIVVPGTVVDENKAPTVGDQTMVLDEDGTASVRLVASDPDAGDTHTMTIVGAPGAGTASLAGSTLRYTPPANWAGTTTLQYRATDNHGAVSNIGTVTITVNEVNDAPQAVPGVLTTNEDEPKSFSLGVDDPDIPYGDTHIFELVTLPGTGTAKVTGNQLTYAPAANWYGTTSLVYRVRDAAGIWSGPATISINVLPVNDPPVASNRTLTTAEDAAGTVTLVASDIEGSSLTYSVEAQPNSAHGTVTITGDKATFTPKPNWNGTTSFTYRAFDGEDYSSPATVSVTVTPVNDAPAASNRTLAINEDTTGTLVLGVTDVDLTFEGDNHAWSIVTPPNAAHGTATITGSTLTFKPALDWFGTATLTYRVRDAAGVYSKTATVTITVNPVNDAPVVISQDMTTDEDTSGTITLGVSDVDPGDVHTFHVVTQPNSLHGVITVVGSKATFAPELNWYGTTTFTFVARDQVGATSNTGTVTVTVISVNDVPVIASPGLVIRTSEGKKVEVQYSVVE